MMPRPFAPNPLPPPPIARAREGSESDPVASKPNRYSSQSQPKHDCDDGRYQNEHDKNGSDAVSPSARLIHSFESGVGLIFDGPPGRRGRTKGITRFTRHDEISNHFEEVYQTLARVLLALGIAGIELGAHPADPGRLRYRPTTLPPELSARLPMHCRPTP
jgi:hypothetical protein